MYPRHCPFAAILRNCQIARLPDCQLECWLGRKLRGPPQRMLWAMVANSIHCRGTCSVLQQPNQHPVLSPHSCPNPPTPDCQIASARLPDWTVYLPLHAWLPRSDCMDDLIFSASAEKRVLKILRRSTNTLNLRAHTIAVVFMYCHVSPHPTCSMRCML